MRSPTRVGQDRALTVDPHSVRTTCSRLISCGGGSGYVILYVAYHAFMPIEADAAYVGIRLSKEERVSWRLAASKRGLRLSSMIRLAVEEFLAGEYAPRVVAAKSEPKPVKVSSPKERVATLKVPAPPPVAVRRQKSHHVRCDCPMCKGAV